MLARARPARRRLAAGPRRRPEYGTLAILRGRDLIFFRNRAEGSDETLADLVHQTAMYYEDRLGGSAGSPACVLAASGAERR